MKLDDDIHNYYEHLVLERIESLGLNKTKSEDYLADLCCLALNQIPPRYIRFEVDMSFYLPASERQQMQMNAINAVNQGISFLENNSKEEKSKTD
ncbi:late competence development ComFB family protein [Paraglaciecola aquimarina]|uniref:Late competence development ComFB family protein n=1 Tax=Paraglaciecola algarum TaxID=3050085 RepID=A0ABS9D4F8_9ALTE|nr:late competence development ComFB family protein [Paraglaciecola sp. G1-23]MCF2946882.1 late competence development ComFB family protein [Paraglaciecola sp. G1-23]